MSTVAGDVIARGLTADTATQEPPPAVKISFNVAPHQVETLKQIAKDRGVTMTEVLRHAIALEAFINEAAKDSRIIVESKKGNDRKEIILLGS